MSPCTCNRLYTFRWITSIIYNLSSALNLANTATQIIFIIQAYHSVQKYRGTLYTTRIASTYIKKPNNWTSWLCNDVSQKLEQGLITTLRILLYLGSNNEIWIIAPWNTSSPELYSKQQDTYLDSCKIRQSLGQRMRIFPVWHEQKRIYVSQENGEFDVYI